MIHKFYYLCACITFSLLFTHNLYAQCGDGVVGPDRMNVGETHTYSMQTPTSHFTYWTTTGDLSIVGNSSQTTSVRVTGSGNGEICYTIGLFNCSYCKTVSVPVCPSNVQITSRNICLGEEDSIVEMKTKFNNTPNQPMTYTWALLSGDGEFLGNRTGSVARLRVTRNSSINVRVTVTCGGRSISATRYVWVPRCNTGPLFSVYPNPVQNTLKLSVPDEERATSKYAVEIVNKYGEVVISQTVQNAEEEVDVSKLKQGMYVVRTKRNGVIVSNKRLMKK